MCVPVGGVGKGRDGGDVEVGIPRDGRDDDGQVLPSGTHRDEEVDEFPRLDRAIDRHTALHLNDRSCGAFVDVCEARKCEASECVGSRAMKRCS